MPFMALTIKTTGPPGVLTLNAGKAVTTQNNDATITAWDVQMLGTVATGSGTIHVHGSKEADRSAARL